MATTSRQEAIEEPTAQGDDQLCFTLYAASRAVTQRYRMLLQEFGLTYPQYLVVRLLSEHSPVAIRDIGAVLHLDYGTLSPLIKRLEAAGLVRRQRGSNDERTVSVSLTEKGAQLHDNTSGVPAAIINAMALSTRDFHEFKAILRKVTAM